MKDLYQVKEYWIDPEIRDELAKLSISSYHGLEQSIIKEGLKQSIQYFEFDSKKIIADGHHRLEICIKHDILIKSKKIDIEGKDYNEIKSNIKSWMLRNQISRRNCSLFVLIEYGIKNEKELIKLAPKEISKTNVKLAHVLNTSEQSIKYTKKILKHISSGVTSNPHLSLALNEGTISIKDAYKELFKKEENNDMSIKEDLKIENDIKPIVVQKQTFKTIEEAVKANVKRMDIHTMGIQKFKDQQSILIKTYEFSKTINLFYHENSFILQNDDITANIDFNTLIKFQEFLLNQKEHIINNISFTLDSIRYQDILLTSAFIDMLIQDIQNFKNSN